MTFGKRNAMYCSKFELDIRAKDYIINKLKNGKELSQEILLKHPQIEGNYYTYLPKNINEDDLYSFVGGMKHLNYELIEEYFHKEAEEFLSHQNSIIVFEDSLLEKKDYLNLGQKTKQLFYQDNVFHFLLSDQNHFKNIETTFRGSSNSWQNLFFFSSLPQGLILKDKEELSKEMIEILAHNAVKVFVDAYDLDGFISWEFKKQKSQKQNS